MRTPGPHFASGETGLRQAACWHRGRVGTPIVRLAGAPLPPGWLRPPARLGQSRAPRAPTGREGADERAVPEGANGSPSSAAPRGLTWLLPPVSRDGPQPSTGDLCSSITQGGRRARGSVQGSNQPQRALLGSRVVSSVGRAWRDGRPCLDPKQDSVQHERQEGGPVGTQGRSVGAGVLPGAQDVEGERDPGSGGLWKLRWGPQATGSRRGSGHLVVGTGQASG